MSFARFSYADVYIFEHAGGFIQCCACLMTEPDPDDDFGFGQSVDLETPRDAIKHLKEHKKSGHDVGGAIAKIKKEYDNLDAKIAPYVPDPEQTERVRAKMRAAYEAGQQKVDMVNHPPHYATDPSGVEAITVLRHRNYNIGNAMKYLWRAGAKSKETEIQDLEKAIFYINDEIKRLKGEA